MATPATVADGYDEASVAGASAARDEPDWLRERRAEAARAFAAMPNPSPASRLWKYTDVTAFDFALFPPASAAISLSGDVPEGSSEYPGAVTTLRAAVEQWPDVPRSDVGKLVPSTEGKFVAANAALWDEGVYIHVPRGVTCDSPIIVDIDATALPEAAIFPRVLVLAGEQAEVTIVLRLRSGETPLLVSGVIELYAHDSSRVRLLTDERWGGQTQDFTTVRSLLGRDADARIATIALGGQLIKQTVEARLAGEGANSVIHGIALGDLDQQFDFVTLQDHEGPRTTSDVAIKAALAGASRNIYYGITRVEESAKGAEANQENRNLLLSANSKADSDPVLEILTSDVIRCGHAAAVGPVDQEALFYLQARGLDYRAALKLLVQGFFQSVAGVMGLPELEEELAEAVTAKLATAEL
ncbi:MAG: SufD family Fe-S cluster assembly protein [Dehalococcoidia bacterium]|jgi:Fe-S cluster assembly protein SufD|nr:SufD family Fe-S cluster assembly protein [Dehalococcoidia bacterium]